mgnify:CR=1 FL=1
MICDLKASASVSWSSVNECALVSEGWDPEEWDEVSFFECASCRALYFTWQCT